MIVDSTKAAFRLGRFCSIALKEQAKYKHDHVQVLATKDLITNLQKQQTASMDLPAGAHVCISGLISRPELNGQQGVVLHFNHKKARYSVRLADGKEMLLKPECLTCT